MGVDQKNIAVVGAGVAGLTTAWMLQRRHRVTLFERNDYPGGHTHTIVIPDGPDAGTPVDTGFIVMNHRNYPLLTRLFEQLGVALRDSDMSFSYYNEKTGLQYSGCGLNGLFAQRSNLFRPSFFRMLRETMRFYEQAPKDLDAGRLNDVSLGDYLRQDSYSSEFVAHHIVPMGAAIWSTPGMQMMDFPAAAFVRFFRNHGLLSLKDRPQWRTVAGGSHEYVKKMLRDFSGEVVLNRPVRKIRRHRNQVFLATDDGPEQVFDAVVIAAHADEALAMLADPGDDEKRLLGPWVYQVNRTVLHTDVSVMPPLRRAWASWNYTRERISGEREPVSLTYHMNNLQGLVTKHPYFVSLNRQRPIPAEHLVAGMDYEHPTYTALSMATQQELPSLNGKNHTWYCGSYFGYGFHEDAVRSALDVTRTFGIDL